MSKKVTTQAPKLYIGMDIHKKTWKIHFCTNISVGSGKTFPPEAEVLKNYVDLQYPDHAVSVAYEAGCCGYDHARSFIDYGYHYLISPLYLYPILQAEFLPAEYILRLHILMPVLHE